MFGFKNAYFYLVALQITFVKFLKKLYFSSNHYNNSLKSKIPVQVYFSPNPFLLSLISPFTKRSFKFNEISPNDFWFDKKNYRYHNFLWLNLVNRKTDEKKIQKIIYYWIIKYSRFKKKIWETSTLSSRVISWMLNVDIIINNGTFEFKKIFFHNIIVQCNHLKKNFKYEKDPVKKLEILTVLILSGIIFKEYEENFNIGIKELEKFVNTHFDKNGFTLSRSKNDLIFFTKYLLLCHENIKEAQQYLPWYVSNIQVYLAISKYLCQNLILRV